MDPLTIGLLTGGASLLGSIFSSDTSAQNTQNQIMAQEQMQQQTEQFNAGQAQLQRDYQTQMSNTAYQRASKDMQAAGLNPMMMFGSGSAASSPAGAAASVGTPTVPMSQRQSPLAGLGDAVQKTVSTAVNAQTFDKMKEEIANTITERSKLEATTDLLKSEKDRTEAQTGLTRVETGLKHLDVDPKLVTAKESDAILDFARKHPDIFSTGNQAAYGARKVGQIIEPVTDTVSSAVGAGRLFKDIWRDRIDRGY